MKQSIGKLATQEKITCNVLYFRSVTILLKITSGRIQYEFF